MSLLFKNYSLVEVINLLIRFNKTKLFSLNTKNTDRNGVNKLNTHTPNTQRKITPEWVSMKISGTPLFKTTPYFTNPSLFMGNI